MEIWQDGFTGLWHGLLLPMARLLLGLSAGLFLANILEALRLTDYLAKIARPISRCAHMGQPASAAFALAFLSPMAANGALSENYARKEISPRELLLANLFNGLPASCMHMQTIFFLLWPVLGGGALVYAGLVLLAAAMRTGFTIILGRCLLPMPAACPMPVPEAPAHWRVRFCEAFAKALRRFRKRLGKLVCFTAPVYALMYWGQQTGTFSLVQAWLADHLGWLSIVKPQAMGIIVMQIVAETGASLGAAGAALETGALTCRDVVVALLAGNVLAAPMRAIRHQLPAYAGLFRPAMALRLVLANQTLRVASLGLVTWLYACFT